MNERHGKSNDGAAECGSERSEMVSNDSADSCSAEAQERSIDTRGSRHIEPRDERIRRYLIEHLAHESRYPTLNDVMFEVKDGRVTLSGTVPHRVMKQSIEDTAASCPGVTHVENNLNVALTAPWPEFSGIPKPLDQG